jgi:hypothetical protein
MTLLNYTDFLLETYAVVNVEKAKRRLLIASARQMGASIDEMESLNFFINEGFTNDLFDLALEINEESYAEKFKAWAIRTKDKIKDGGKAVINKLGDGAKAALKFGGSLLAPLKAVVTKIGDIVKKAWEIGKEKANSAVAAVKDKIIDKVENIIKDGDRAKNIKEEIENLKALASTAYSWLGAKYALAMYKSAEDAATTDENYGYVNALQCALYESAAVLIEEGYDVSTIEEELQLLEGGGGDEGGLNIPFISSIMKKVASIPPFSAFHKIEDVVAKKVEGGLNKFSAFMTQVASAPGPFTFPVVAGLVGIAAGYLAETGFKKSLISLEGLLGFAIPGWGILIKVIKYTGLALAVYGVIKQLVGQDKKDDKEGNKEDKSGEKPEE